MTGKNTRWKMCCGLVIALSALAFSPFVLIPGQIDPELLGIPFSLWAGILIAFTLVALTFIAGLVHPASATEDEQNRENHC